MILVEVDVEGVDSKVEVGPIGVGDLDRWSPPASTASSPHPASAPPTATAKAAAAMSERRDEENA